MNSTTHSIDEWNAVAEQAMDLLKQLIATKSYSGQEYESALIIEKNLQSHGFEVERIQNNVLARGKHWVDGAPVLLLNSHPIRFEPHLIGIQIHLNRLKWMENYSDWVTMMRELLWSVCCIYFIGLTNAINRLISFLASAEEEISG